MPESRKRLPKGYRLITVTDPLQFYKPKTQSYLYKVGKRFVDIRTPEGSRFRLAPLTEVVGMSWEEIERGQHKRCFSVTPSQVSDYILSITS